MAKKRFQKASSYAKKKARLNRASRLFTRGTGMGPEVKQMVTQANLVAVRSTNVGTNWMYLLNGTAQGTKLTERIGTRILMKSIQIGITLRLPELLVKDPTGGAPIENDQNNVQTFVRFVIFVDRQQNGVASALGDIYLDPSHTENAGVASTGQGVNTPRNLAYRDRFLILKDWRVRLSPWDKAGAELKFYKKLGIETTYNGPGNPASPADPGTISTNGLWLGAYCDRSLEGVGGTIAWPFADYTSNLRYTDP